MMLLRRLMRFVCNRLRYNRACPRLTSHLQIAMGGSSQRVRRKRRTNYAYTKRVCGGSAGPVRGCAPRFCVVHRFGGGSDAVRHAAVLSSISRGVDVSRLLLISSLLGAMGDRKTTSKPRPGLTRCTSHTLCNILWHCVYMAVLVL
jgi:hypothetical protein